MEIARLVLNYLEVLIWPAVTITVCLAFRQHLVALLTRIRHAELPGGVAVDLEQEIREARELSAEVQGQLTKDQKKGARIPLTEANARLINLGLRPSPSGLDMSYYRDLAAQDPNLALAGLRMEMDILARNLAKGFKIPIGDRDFGLSLIRLLRARGAITETQMQLAMKVLHVCNLAVHGTPVSQRGADDVIDSADVLAEQYLDWLSWGFDDGWSPTREKAAG